MLLVSNDAMQNVLEHNTLSITTIINSVTLIQEGILQSWSMNFLFQCEFSRHTVFDRYSFPFKTYFLTGIVYLETYHFSYGKTDADCLSWDDGEKQGGGGSGCVCSVRSPGVRFSFTLLSLLPCDDAFSYTDFAHF